jgi:hypothetical protein
MAELENSAPKIHVRSSKRVEQESDFDDNIAEKFDQREIFGMPACNRVAHV